MEPLSALIVETNPAGISLIRECLEQSRDYLFEVKTAASLEAAQKMTAHYDFEVILANPFLPDATGLEVVRRLIGCAPEAAVIVVADRREDHHIELESVRFGAQDYLEKQQLSPAVLHKSILYSIERNRVLQEKEDLLSDLALALKKIDSLENVLPMCRYCKKVRWDSDSWLEFEDYLGRYAANRDIRLICPDCIDNI